MGGVVPGGSAPDSALGICAVGRTIHDAVGNLAAITIAMPLDRFTGREHELAEQLIETTTKVNAALALAPEAVG